MLRGLGFGRASRLVGLARVREFTSSIFEPTPPRSRWPSLRAFEQVMDQLAPLRLAENWDNVGLLVESHIEPRDIKVLCAVDVNERVLDEATALAANVIVSYHPTLFRPTNRLLQSTPVHAAVVRALANGISIYSPHTALDTVPGGVNDWLADGLGEGERSVCSPHPLGNSSGIGRVVRLKEAASLDNLVARIKHHLGLKMVRVARPDGAINTVKTVALCAGSGSVLAPVQAEVYWTGEMGHHEVLAAVNRGVAVVLCEHSNTERGFLPVLAGRLRDAGVSATVSVADREPLCIE